MFAPADGVPEDPATGSAAGPLAACVARHGLAPFAEEIVISQGAELGRPSTLYARVEGTPERFERSRWAGQPSLSRAASSASDARPGGP